MSIDVSKHPKRQELLRILALWVKRPDDALQAFTEAVGEYEILIGDRVAMPTSAEERNDLQNLDKSIVDVLQRIDRFPPIAESKAYLALSRVDVDFMKLLDTVRRDLTTLRAGIAGAMPAEKLPVGHRPKSRNSVAHSRLESNLADLLRLHGRDGLINHAAMADDVAKVLRK